VENFDQAVAFYRDALGLEQIADWSSATGRVVVLEAGRGHAGAVRPRAGEAVDAIEAGRRVSGTVRFAVQVEDSVELAGRLVEAGAERVSEPVIAPWGDRNARVKGPDGMQLTLFTSGGRFRGLGASSSRSRSISRPSWKVPSGPRSYWRMTPTGRKPTLA
jgi:catechol 2,3-dioxygenase-like lactoylglutathione lyase family enzyme